MKKWFNLFIVSLIFFGGFCVSSIAHAQSEVSHGISKNVAVHHDVLDCCDGHEKDQKVASFSRFQPERQLDKFVKQVNLESVSLYQIDARQAEFFLFKLFYPLTEAVVFLE